MYQHKENNTKTRRKESTVWGRGGCLFKGEIADFEVVTKKSNLELDEKKKKCFKAGRTVFPSLQLDTGSGMQMIGHSRDDYLDQSLASSTPPNCFAANVQSRSSTVEVRTDTLHPISLLYLSLNCLLFSYSDSGCYSHTMSAAQLLNPKAESRVSPQRKKL